jgi:alkanesulfonate monooxygenase SsuD/methylene tetrahydromethanopterin reductase-like flavin-dependent oxidoreductase (luciferase family)
MSQRSEASEMRTPPTIGTQLPSRELIVAGRADARIVLDLATALEDRGAHGVWVGESVTARPRFDAYSLLAAIAGVTTRVQIGTSVVLPALRSPVEFAHQVATIDRLASGRLVLGVGAGFPSQETRHEFESLGRDYRRRASTLDATLAAAQAIWAGAFEDRPAADPTTRFGFAGVRVAPAPVRPTGPPVWLATATASGLERCARAYDGWLPYPVSPADYAYGLSRLRNHANDTGRDAASITAGLFVTVATGPGADDRMEQFCQRYYGLGADVVGLVQGLVAGSLERVADVLAAYVAAGADELVIRHATFEPEVVLDESSAIRDLLRGR